MMHALRRLQAEWDEQNAIAPMPVARPSLAAIAIGGALLLALLAIVAIGLAALPVTGPDLPR